MLLTFLKGKETSISSKFLMYLAGDLSAFKTPKGVQLNLYLNLFGFNGKPPHILVKLKLDKSSFLIFCLKSSTNFDAKI